MMHWIPASLSVLAAAKPARPAPTTMTKSSPPQQPVEVDDGGLTDDNEEEEEEGLAAKLLAVMARQTATRKILKYIL